MSEEKIYQDIRADFESKYASVVVPKLTPFEDNRKKTLKKTIIIIAVALPLALVFFFLGTIFKGALQNVFYTLSVISLGLSVIAYPLFKKGFETKLKNMIMPVVCGCFPDLKWVEVTRETYDYISIYKTSGLLSDFNSYSFDDCFKGSYNGVGFEIIEFDAQKEKGSGKDKQVQDVFDGVIISLDMNKNFSCNTVLRPHSFVNFPPTFKLRRTTLEDVEFEKKFDVYTDDEVEARYLLTTSLMERLNTMQVAFKANKVAGAFYNEKFYVALYSKKDLFAIGSLLKDVCDREQFFTMFEEILSIIKLIDHFKLNQKIGM